MAISGLGGAKRSLELPAGRGVLQRGGDRASACSGSIETSATTCDRADQSCRQPPRRPAFLATWAVKSSGSIARCKAGIPFPAPARTARAAARVLPGTPLALQNMAERAAKRQRAAVDVDRERVSLDIACHMRAPADCRSLPAPHCAPCPPSCPTVSGAGGSIVRPR